MITSILFDLGGVLLRTFDDSGRREWSARLNLGEWGAEQAVFKCPANAAAERGEISDADLWRDIQQRLALDDANLAQFRTDFWRGDRLDSDMIGLLQALRGRYSLGLLSNATTALREVLPTPRFAPLPDLFDMVMISCEEKLRKPDPEIYRRALTRIGAQAHETAFVDDALDNIEGARAVGLAAVRFESAQQVMRDLRALGVQWEQ